MLAILGLLPGIHPLVFVTGSALALVSGRPLASYNHAVELLLDSLPANIYNRV